MRRTSLIGMVLVVVTLVSCDQKPSVAGDATQPHLTQTEISGKVMLRGRESNFDITVGCLGKNQEGKLEGPGAGFKLDGSSHRTTCMTWKPRNSTLAWDKAAGHGSHRHVNRPPGHYLVYLRGNRTKGKYGHLGYQGYYDWKWVELKDDRSEVNVDLTMDLQNVGSVEVTLRGETTEKVVTYLPLDEQGKLPLPEWDCHRYMGFSCSAAIEDGKAVVKDLRPGKYQFAITLRDARGPSVAKADVEVQRGTTAKVELILEKPPPAITWKKRTGPAIARKRRPKSEPRSRTGTINLLATAKYSSSSNSARIGDVGYDAAKAFDGDLGTRWNSKKGNAVGAWLAARRDRPVTIHKVVVRQAHDRMIAFVIERFDGTKNGWVHLLYVFADRHVSSYSREGKRRGWGYLPDAVWVDGKQLGDQKDRVFGTHPDGSVHPVFTLNLPDPLTTTGIRMRVQRIKGASVSIFEMEAYGPADRAARSPSTSPKATSRQPKQAPAATPKRGKPKPKVATVYLKRGRVLKAVALDDRGDKLVVTVGSGIKVTLKKEDIERVVKAGEGK